MISPKQPYVDLLFAIAAEITHAPLGQMDDKERAELYVRLRDMAAAGDQVDLGEATKLVVTEVIRAATSIERMLVPDFTGFIDGQLRGGSMAPGAATLGLLQDLGLDQEWVVFVDKEDGELFAATAEKYQGILDEVAGDPVVAIPGLPSLSDLPEGLVTVQEWVRFYEF